VKEWDLVKALKCVDCVVAQDDYSPINNIKSIKPDVLIESSSHSEENLLKVKELANAISCKVIVMPYYPGQSSTQIKEGIRNNIADSGNQDSLNKEPRREWNGKR